MGAVLVSSLTAAPGLSRFLQKYMGKLVGPIMIILGMFLLERLVSETRGETWIQNHKKRSRAKACLVP